MKARQYFLHFLKLSRPEKPLSILLLNQFLCLFAGCATLVAKGDPIESLTGESYLQTNRSVTVGRALFRSAVERELETEELVSEIRKSLKQHFEKGYITEDLSKSTPSNIYARKTYPYVVGATVTSMSGISELYIYIKGASANRRKIEIIFDSRKENLSDWGIHSSRVGKHVRIHRGIKRASDTLINEDGGIKDLMIEFTKKHPEGRINIVGSSFGGALTDGIVAKIHSPSGEKIFGEHWQGVKKNLHAYNMVGFKIGNADFPIWMRNNVPRYTKIASVSDWVVPFVASRNPLKPFYDTDHYKASKLWRVGHFGHYALFKKINKDCPKTCLPEGDVSRHFNPFDDPLIRNEPSNFQEWCKIGEASNKLVRSEKT